MKVEGIERMKNNDNKDNKNGIGKPRIFTEGYGRKDVYFQTFLEDAKQNYIGVKVMSEDGITCNKTISGKDAGNTVAVALEALTNMKFPVGTRFNVKISFDYSDTLKNKESIQENKEEA